MVYKPQKKLLAISNEWEKQKELTAIIGIRDVRYKSIDIWLDLKL